MEEIKKILHEGEKGHSLVVKTISDEIFSFDGRGISDLMRLLNTSPDTLKGAMLADKVVGKAAAALMILGGIKAIHADTISEPALQLFASSATDLQAKGLRPIDVTYNNKVEYIINQAKTGWCPMELATKDAATPKECLARIKAKLQELHNNKR